MPSASRCRCWSTGAAAGSWPASSCCWTAPRSCATRAPVAARSGRGRPGRGGMAEVGALGGARAALVAVGLGLWFWTQRLIGQRPAPRSARGSADRPLHGLDGSGGNRAPARPPRVPPTRLLIVSSAVIDLARASSCSVAAILGPDLPAGRSACSLLYATPLRPASARGSGAFSPPARWDDLGARRRFPSLLVNVTARATDLFFSGPHRQFAV